jgi:glyoxylase-like metal-dependent hydrolase (beta-lactamase superfamily II)
MLVTGSLVIGTQAVVVVDAGFTLDQGAAIADRVAATGLPLQTILITHEHPDHYLGAASLLARWPDASLLATPEVVAGIVATGDAKLAKWRLNLGDRLPSSPTVPQALTSPTLDLDGESIEVLSLGQGDCRNNTAVHVPAARAVIAGDFAYSGTHVWLVETDHASRRAWQANLDRLSALDPTTVIAGHASPGASTGPDVLVATRDYLDVFDIAFAASEDPDGLTARLSAQYPDHALPLVLQLSAQAAFGSGH